ncbi:MAG: nuclear transport factor 2 family protein [Bacteroidota bacterium]
MNKILIVLIAATLLQSCESKPKVHEKKDIDAAMREYDRVLQTLDADAIAALYDEEGDLGEQAHGREAIRKFLSGFKDIEVLSQLSSTNNIEMLGDSAVQTGSYVQIDVVGKKDTITVRGTYTALWRWDGDAWKIKRMETQSTSK